MEFDGTCPHGEYHTCQIIAVENGVTGSCKVRSAVALSKKSQPCGMESRVSGSRNMAGLPVCSDTVLASWPQAASRQTLELLFQD